MSDLSGATWKEQAARLLRHGQLDAAIEMLRRALSAEPDDAGAHALLALCLIDAKRLHAAAHEAAIAITLAPELPLAHLARGLALMAARKFKPAEEHLRQALELDPEDPIGYRKLADLYQFTGREKALGMDPQDMETLVDLGEWRLRRGDLAAAAERAAQALQAEPEGPGALVLMGNVLLREGRIDEAREHAAWALRQRPNSRGALFLIAAIKARTSPLLGLWWRWASWMGTLGDGRSLLVLLGAYAIYRVADQAVDAAGHPALGEAVSVAWLAIVAYTWFGPTLFQRSLRKELAQVHLEPDF